MFLGQYSHRLDQKDRVSIPKKFRDQLGTAAILTRGLDGCLFLYGKEEWEKLSSQVNRLPLTGSDARALSRYLFASAVEANFDPLGRIKIPDYLLTYAKIRKEVTIIGVSNRVEIWSKERYQTLSKKIAKESESIAEKLSGSGI